MQLIHATSLLIEVLNVNIISNMIEPAFTQKELKEQFTEDQILSIIANAGEKTHIKIWKDKKTGIIEITPTYFKAIELNRCISNGQLFVEMEEFKLLLKTKFKY